MIINYQTIDTPENAYRKISEIITDEYIANLKLSAKVEYDDNQLWIKGTGKGFKLTLQFLDEGCEIDLNLSFILRPLKSKLLSKIEKELNENM